MGLLEMECTSLKFLKSVIPFRYEVTEEETSLYVTQYCKKKLYLKERSYGNKCFIQRMRDEMYVLSIKQQNMIKEIKKVREEWPMDQKKVAVKKFDSVIHQECCQRFRERRNEKRRNEERQNEERRNDKRRNEERSNEQRRPRDPRMYRTPDFRPSYRRPDFKLKVFWRPPYAQQLMPTSQ
ncbi:hypothetical protein TNCV_1488591 [Trichonephila clavipes]|nr:hypothetical protein TNCV_1488591 [Trichonephila clavipes]